jgi:hypothetical protein
VQLRSARSGPQRGHAADTGSAGQSNLQSARWAATVMSPASLGRCLQIGPDMHTCTHHAASGHLCTRRIPQFSRGVVAACAEVAGFTTNLQPPDQGIGRVGAGTRPTSRIGLMAANGGQ